MTIISYVRTAEDVARKAATAGNIYTLRLENNSASPWTFYVYQQLPNQESANVFSLAWFCSPYQIVPGNFIRFQWEIDYGFVWGDTGAIQPGVIFDAGGIVPANLMTANNTIFTTQPGPHLTSPEKGDPAGSLKVSDENNVPNNRFSVGISMSGAGTFVTPAGPNLDHIFTPTPSYWIAAGTNVRIGTILNIATITRNKEVEFPHAEFDRKFSLNQANTWVAQD